MLWESMRDDDSSSASVDGILSFVGGAERGTREIDCWRIMDGLETDIRFELCL